ncbi:hypothetical protein C5K15_18040 [Shigella dysenteriae]|uniref:Nitrite extrusion protein 2 n=1 Tax=Shigella dysenteriae TaxID=622 RepID=A0A2S8DC22_SHIDY|nr:hypothetical protein SDB_01300 [Shigella dysenteriae CDC 74-1112]PQN07640.1 hypothetical protein C5K18_11755 [Shigella dysenteriae]PQO00320.1 hypothetical protein C5K15_18040 [Shigella dysenteriae]
MTSLKTSIKTITYLSDTGCLEIQGASLTHINHLANINDHNGLSQQEIADILKLYPDAFNAA